MPALCACATRPAGFQDADPALVAGITRIQLRPVPALAPRAERLSRYGSGLGIAGRALDAAVDAGDNARYAALLEAKGLSLTRRLIDGLEAAFRRRGITMVPDPTQACVDDRRGAGASIAGRLGGGLGRALGDDRPRGPLPPVDADAQLELAVRYAGWLGAGSNTPLRPTLRIEARLVDAAGRHEWWRQTLAYHEIEAPDDALVLDPPGACAYPDLDAIAADPARARACLEDALDASVDRLVASLTGVRG